MNAHDVDVYVFMKSGVYIYDADAHSLKPVLSGDYRSQMMMKPPPLPPDAAAPAPPSPVPGATRPAPSNSPVQIFLISDCSRFRAGTQELKYEWGAIDAGIVSQNISLFCAATGLKTRPRASMDKEKVRSLLRLAPTQLVFLHHPVGYSK